MRLPPLAATLLFPILALVALASAEPAGAQRAAASAAEPYRLTGLGCTPQPFDGRGVAVCRLTLQKSSPEASPGHGVALTCEPASTCPFEKLALGGGLPAEGPAGQSLVREIRLSPPGTPSAGFDWQDGSYRLTASITSAAIMGTTRGAQSRASQSTSFVVKGGAPRKQTAASLGRRTTPSTTPSGRRAAVATPHAPELTPLRPDLKIVLTRPSVAPHAEVTNVGSASSPPVTITYTCKRWCDKNFQVACTSTPPPPTQIGPLQPGQSAKDIVGGAVIGLDDAGCPLTVQLSATVDPANQVIETDEANNTDHLQFGY